MEHVRKKLNSRSGVSILIALIIFLVASMAAVVILDASVTAVRRVNDDQEQQQAYLAISSAARMVASSLQDTGGNSYKVKITVEDYTEAGYTDTLTWEAYGPLKRFLETAVSSTFATDTDVWRKVATGGSAYTTEITFDPQEPYGLTYEFPEVTLHLTMQPYDPYNLHPAGVDVDPKPGKNYRLEGVFTVAGSEQKIYFVAKTDYQGPMNESFDQENSRVQKEVLYTTVTNPETGDEDTVNIGVRTTIYLRWGDVKLSTFPMEEATS